MKNSIFIFVIIMFMLFVPFASSDEIEVGVTFSPIQCDYLEQSWESVYDDILQMGFSLIRLGAYWSEIEAIKGSYDFSRLDLQIEKAKSRGIAIVLTVGMKAPRWPEYFIPEWVLKNIKLKYAGDVSKNEYLRSATLRFVKEVLNRYKDEDAIICWQVENEPLDKAGPNLWYIDKAFLREEAALIRNIDKRQRPLMINIATYPNKILRYMNIIFSANNPLDDALDICDILGLNIYPVIGQRFLGINMVFNSTPDSRNKYIKKIKEKANANNTPIWITELQAEPWDPGKLVHIDQAQPVTSSPSQIEKYFLELRSLDINTIFLWGAEYWFFREESFHDISWRDIARDLIGTRNTR